MKCLELKGEQLTITEEALMVNEFAQLWQRDKSRAVQEFKYIVLTNSYDPTNPFRDYPEEEKAKRVAKHVFGKEITPDKLLRAAIERYNDIQDQRPALRLYKAAKTALENLVTHLETTDLGERDERGKPIHSVSQFTNTLAKASQLSESLRKLAEQVEKEEFETKRTKGQREINPFER